MSRKAIKSKQTSRKGKCKPVPRKGDLAAIRPPVQIRICQLLGCGRIIQSSRNSDFCCNQCRFRFRRIIDDDDVVHKVKHSSWRKAQKMIQDSRDGDESFNDLWGIKKIIDLYARAARFQKGYNTIDGKRLIDKKTGNPQTKLTALIEIQLGHLYPKKYGGRSDPNCIVLSLKLVNKMIGSKTFKPSSKWAVRFFSPERLANEEKGKKMKGELLRTLVEKFGKEPVAEMVHSLKLSEHNPLEIREYHPVQKPLLTLMMSEFARLDMGYIAHSLRHFLHMKADMLGDYDEVIALACNIAIQTQDTHGLLDAIRRYDSALGSRSGKNIVERTSGYVGDDGIVRDICEGSQLYDILERTRQAIKQILKVDALLRPKDMESLYKSMFSVPPEDFKLQQLPMVARGSAFHPEHPDYKDKAVQTLGYRHCPPPAKAQRVVLGSMC